MNFKLLIERISRILNYSFLEIGEFSISLGSILFLFVSVIILFFIAGKIKNILIKKVLKRYNIAVSSIETISAITYYVIIILGLVVIVQSAGINLSALGFLAGALGVGIGFGLQNITNNFVSGLIILFEKPIKIGDRVEVGNVLGQVHHISARATTIITNNNISIIVPNSEFISAKVTNWSHNDNNIRMNIPVGVSYKEDPEVVREILMQIAVDEEGVLDYPEPEVLFEEFADSALMFNLRVWTFLYTTRPSTLKSKLYFEIFKKFKEKNIEIPFPQRDIHLKSGFEKVPLSSL